MNTASSSTFSSKPYSVIRLLGLVCLLVLPFLSHAQNNTSWRYHLNFSRGEQLVYGNNQVFVSNGEALMVYDEQTGQLLTLDKAKGLSSSGITAMVFNENLNQVVVAYENSTIDVIDAQSLNINTIPDIANEIISGSKRINALMVNEAGETYAATDFGVVQLNIERLEIINTFVIGSDGSPVQVSDVAYEGGRLFAATDEGVKISAGDTLNLLDFANWSHVQDGLAEAPSIQLAANTDSVFAAREDSLFLYTDSTWQLLFSDSTTQFESILVSNNQLYSIQGKLDTAGNIFRRDLLVWQDSSWLVLDSSQQFSADYTATSTTSGYLVSRTQGLLAREGSEFRRVGAPNAPFNNTAVSIDFFSSSIYVSGGRVSRTYVPSVSVDGFYVFDGETWQNVNVFNQPNMTDVRDVLSMKGVEGGNTIYAGTSTGLLKIENNIYTLYDSTNSPLRGKTGNEDYAVISDIAIEPDGSVWVLNYFPILGGQPLHKLSPDGTWESFTPPSNNELFKHAVLDFSNQLWIADGSDGLVVRTQSGNFIRLTSSEASGNLPNTTVESLALDNNGALWVGTEEGVAVFDCPEQVEDDPGCRTSRQIRATLGEYTEFLFETDVVKAIAVDGANRKWVGTENGAWLVSETGEEEIYRFTVDNSPLPSNNIIDIGILQNTGEVFFATDLGLVSFFGDATQGAENHDDVSIYPNPVRPEYTGPISIDGLVENAWVKITDLSGQLIYEGQALGGKFTWNASDYNNERGKTGVYLVYSSNSDGSEKFVGKLVLIN